MITPHFHLQPQYNMHFIYISHHFTAQEDMNSTNLTSLPMCGFIAQLAEHRAGVAEVKGSNPIEALIFFRLLLSNILNWKFTAMITPHFHLQLQYNMHFLYISHKLSELPGPSPCYGTGLDLKQIYNQRENDKKRLHTQRVMDVKQGTFAPLIFATRGC